MEQYVSFHKLMDYLKQEQVNSPRLNDFGYGDIVYFVNDSGTTVTYPFLFVTPVNVTYAENTTTYSLQMIFADIVNTDLSNEVDVVSDMSLEARRFLSVVKRGFLMDKVDVTLPSVANSFFERFNDHVGGVVLNADIVVFEDINACDPYPEPSQTPTNTPTPSITPTITPTPSITPTNTPSVTPTLTPSITPTITPSSSPLPVPFETEYQTLLSNAEGLGYALPPIDEQVRQNDLMVELKDEGLWDKLFQFYLFSADLTAGGFTFLNWVNGLWNLTPSRTGSNPFPNYEGLNGYEFSNGNHLLFPVSPYGTLPDIRTSGYTTGVYVIENNGVGSDAEVYFRTNNNSWGRLLNNDTAAHYQKRRTTTTSVDMTGVRLKAVSQRGDDTISPSDLERFFYNDGTEVSRTLTGLDGGTAGGSFSLNGFGSNFSWNCGLYFMSKPMSSTELVTFDTIIKNYINLP